jgi:hypothetical protein
MDLCGRVRSNRDGQLCDDSTTCSDVPIAGTGLGKRVIAGTAGGDFSLDLKSDGSVPLGLA